MYHLWFLDRISASRFLHEVFNTVFLSATND